jgi:hypothetical protein
VAVPSASFTSAHQQPSSFAPQPNDAPHDPQTFDSGFCSVILLIKIRFAGRAITVDYRSLTPPYTIDVIGNPDTLPARLLETPGGQAWMGLKTNYGIRFDTTTASSLVLPADPSTALRQARAVGAR